MSNVVYRQTNKTGRFDLGRFDLGRVDICSFRLGTCNDLHWDILTLKVFIWDVLDFGTLKSLRQYDSEDIMT